VRQAITQLAHELDADAATAVWEAALATVWERPPVWVHGDIANSNLLVMNGRLSAVLDFGCSAVGDPACDLAIAWTFFVDESREAFRGALALDEDTCARNRGGALWKAQAAVVARVAGSVRDLRRAGSAALDLAWVAAGRLDAYFEVSRSPWDSAAGELLVREAGGEVTWTEQTEIVASGRPLHAPLIALLRAAHENSG